MADDIAIRVENLGKRYRIGAKEEAHDTLAGMLGDWVMRPGHNLRRLRRLTQFDENGLEQEDIIWALKDVSFEVKRGEVVGIIGRNGAGKSTLLKILSRITHPTKGRVELNGRVSSLLEVGTGFHPELTGRENIYLNGTILGMRKAEIDRKFDEIVDFSGVEKFIDTPVKRYSSGMRVRLAFSVAAHLEPEILLVDEVLAVGDAEFQKKCLGKMGQVASDGRTVIFVSHNMGSVESLCQRVLYLNAGEIRADGATDQIISLYIGQNTFDSPSVDLSSHLGRRPAMKSVISHISLMNDAGSSVSSFQTGDQITFELTLDPKETNYDYPAVSIAVLNNVGVLVCKLASWAQSRSRWKFRERVKVRCIWTDCRLAPGRYLINFGFADGAQVIDYIEYATTIDIVSADIFGTGKTGSGLFIPDANWHIM